MSDSEEDSLGGGLEAFFTCKEYVLQSHAHERVEVRCWSLLMNTTDADLTGTATEEGGGDTEGRSWRGPRPSKWFVLFCRVIPFLRPGPLARLRHPLALSADTVVHAL